MSGKQKPSGWGPLGAGPQRLNKVLAAAGLGSRRACDEFISEGRVEVNGEVVAQLGLKVDPIVDQIKFDGESLKKHKPVYYALNKPPGIVSTNSDPDGRPRVIDLVPDKERLFSVGRLDRSSEGLMLLTNDGELAQRLAHPKFQITKTYYVTVQGQIDVAHLARLERGIHLAEGFAKVDKVKIRNQRRHATDLEIELSEGKNREIRRILAKLGHKVVELKRVAIGTLRLGDIPSGAYRPLSADEVRKLYEEADAQRHKKKETRKRKPGSMKVVAPGPIEDELDDEDLANELEAEQMLEGDDLGVVIDYSGEVGDDELMPAEEDFDGEDNWDSDELPNVIIDEDGDEIFLPPSVTDRRKKSPTDRDSQSRGPREGSRDTGRDRGPLDRGPRDRGPRDRGPGDRGPGDRGSRDRGPRDGGGERTGSGRDRGPRSEGFRDRPPRGDAPRGDRPRFDRPRGDGPRGDARVMHLAVIVPTEIVPTEMGPIALLLAIAVHAISAIVPLAALAVTEMKGGIEMKGVTAEKVLVDEISQIVVTDDHLAAMANRAAHSVNARIVARTVVAQVAVALVAVALEDVKVGETIVAADTGIAVHVTAEPVTVDSVTVDSVIVVPATGALVPAGDSKAAVIPGQAIVVAALVTDAVVQVVAGQAVAAADQVVVDRAAVVGQVAVAADLVVGAPAVAVGQVAVAAGQVAAAVDDVGAELTMPLVV